MVQSNVDKFKEELQKHIKEMNDNETHVKKYGFSIDRYVTINSELAYVKQLVYKYL